MCLYLVMPNARLLVVIPRCERGQVIFKCIKMTMARSSLHFHLIFPVLRAKPLQLAASKQFNIASSFLIASSSPLNVSKPDENALSCLNVRPTYSCYHCLCWGLLPLLFLHPTARLQIISASVETSSNRNHDDESKQLREGVLTPKYLIHH